MASSIIASEVMKAFNERQTSGNWKARAYLTPRADGSFNVVHFTYGKGMVSFVMDCDQPLVRAFKVKFLRPYGAWGDYVAAIQRGLYTILGTLADAGYPFDVPLGWTPSDIWFGVNKRGDLYYLAIVTIDKEQFEHEGHKKPIKAGLADDLC